MTANAEQAQAWNGAEGQFFVAEQARHERMMEPHTDRMLAAAGIEPGDAVLDIGCGCGQTTIRAARCAPRGYALGAASLRPPACRPSTEAGFWLRQQRTARTYGLGTRDLSPYPLWVYGLIVIVLVPAGSPRAARSGFVPGSGKSSR